MVIKSITDVITNSSSETFLIKTDKSFEELTKEIGKIVEENSWYFANGSGVEEFEEPGYLTIDVDQELKDFQRYIYNNYFVVDLRENYGSPLVALKDTGRVIGRDSDFPTDYPPGTTLVDEGFLFNTLENKGWIKSLLDPEVQKKRIEKYKKILAGEEEDFYLIEHWKKEGLELTPEAIIEDDIKFATNWLIEHES